MKKQKLYRCTITTTEVNYILADNEEQVKEKAICGDIQSSNNQDVLIDDIEIAEKNTNKGE